MPINNFTSHQQLAEDYQLVEQALKYIENHYHDQPSLEQIASQVGLSEYYFQRVFARWVGISPKRFMQFLTKEYARKLLDLSSSVLEATYQSGLSSPGRLHDLFVTMEAVTPGEYKLHGMGLKISYGFHPSPFGECMLALTRRGICGLAFVTNGNRQDPLDDLRRRWMRADLSEEPEQTVEWVEKVFPHTKDTFREPLNLFLNGTNFQIKVWEGLMRIPSGSLVTYQSIAAYLGNPKSSRAVGHAVAANPISFIIPCHRVIRKMGVFGEYRWGAARKKAILGWELARA